MTTRIEVSKTMDISNDNWTRRDCLKHLTAGAAVGLTGVVPALGEPTRKVRHVLAFSDTHIGRKDDGLDGGEWLAKGLAELKENKVPADYALVLGDIAHGATEEAYKTFTKLRDESYIDTWFELAGNHEYHDGKSEHYEKLVRPIKPYSHTDGNIAWFFISDEKPGVKGDLTDESIEWLKRGLAENQDKIVIVCSHQLVNGTVRVSDSPQRYIHPKEKIAEVLDELRVDLWLCGHEHHKPYSQEEIARKDGTTFINIASMSHAYGTKESQSYLLEFVQGEKKIVARRRVHDKQAFDKDYEIEVPLTHAVQLT